MSTGMIAFLIYLFTRVDAIGGLFEAVFWISAIALGLLVGISLIIQYPIAQDGKCSVDGHLAEPSKHARGVALKQLWWLIPLAFINVLWPNQKDLVFIVGGALGYEAVSIVVADERVQETGGKAYEALNRWLDQVAEESAEEAESQSD